MEPSPVSWKDQPKDSEYELAKDSEYVSPDLSYRSFVDKYTPGSSVYGKLSYKPHYTAELDKDCFKQIVDKLNISPSSDNSFVDVMICLGGSDHKKDIDLLKTACELYDYPESEDLGSNEGLIDWELPFILYDNSSLSHLKSPEPLLYQENGTLFDEINRYETVNETVDANTGKAVGWYINSSVTLDKDKIYSSKMKEVNGFYYYVGQDPERDFIKNIVKKDYKTKALK